MNLFYCLKGLRGNLLPVLTADDGTKSFATCRSNNGNQRAVVRRSNIRTFIGRANKDNERGA